MLGICIYYPLGEWLIEVGNHGFLNGRCIIQILLAFTFLGIGGAVVLALQNQQLWRHIRNQEILTQELRVRSDYDVVSSLKNRNYFASLAQQIEKQNTPVAVLVCDIDGLKIINDTLGHMAGDTIIRKAAEVLRETSPVDAQIFRMGGDEFLVLILKVLSEGELASLYNSIKSNIENYNRQQPALPLSMSIGFSASTYELNTLREVVKQADHNMYQEKRIRQGKVYSNIREALVE